MMFTATLFPLPFLPLLLLLLLPCLTLSVPLVHACLPPHDIYPFCNLSLPLEARIDNLLSLIHDDEKPNLLTARGGPHGLQNFSRIGVPSYYWGTNCLHSVGAPCTSDGHCPTNFPSGPSMAATYDRTLMQDVAIVVGRELRALYNLGVARGLDCWGPVINLNRDPRWGRNGEGGAEDPYLMGELAAAWTRGFQGGRANETRGYLQGVLTLKHYVANSLENTIVRHNVTVDGVAYVAGSSVSRHTMNVTISNHGLQDYLAAFRAAAKAGARGMMCSYNAVNGIPTCLSPMLRNARELWTGKSPWGGYITSDSDSVSDATHSHHYTSSDAEASCLAVREGADDVDSGNTYYNALLDGVRQGLCSMTDVDGAVRNTLRVRFELGLFDPPSAQPLTRLGSAAVGSATSASLNLRATAESLVLLKNDGGVLPLRAGMKIAVVGPHANASRFLLQVDTGQVCDGDGTFDCVQSPYAAIAKANIGGETTLAVGCDIINSSISTSALLDEAVAAAQAAEIVVLAIGIAQCGCMGITDTYMGGKATNPHGCATAVVPPYTPWGNCWSHQEVPAGDYIGAEAHDRVLIDLPPVQRALAARIFALGKPTVLVVLNGGSVDIGPELAASKGALEAFYPGLQGAAVIANALFAIGPHANRFGRMPYTMYEAAFVNQTSMMEHELSAPPGRTHKYYTGTPVVPFGFGLSYSTFHLSLASPPNITIHTTGSGGAARLLLVASNQGAMVGDLVLLAYLVPLHLPTQPASRLRQKLFDFMRVADMEAGLATSLEFNLTALALALVDTETGDIISAPGLYAVIVTDGSGRPQGRVEVQLTIAGPQRVLEPFPSATSHTQPK